MNELDKKFLKLAIEHAKKSVAQGGFPAGAVIVKDSAVIGEGISVGNALNDPTSHGEMAAIRNACQNLETSDLSGAVLYASMQPCLMCFGASMWAAVGKIIFACGREKVSSAYYGGDYAVKDINRDLSKPIEFIHGMEMEEESLAIVRTWEASLRV